ncbi:ParA family protein [Listeria sp. FSL L7-1509]|nr:MULTISPECIES: ParA family protein [Listeria]MBC1484521.1 ParA family protein [Listeria immobilis]MBC1508262.1 ParA family protein [Listeria immobilis]MBC1839523.1 ParA family protein [Listeria seeligeri]MBC6313687.1 ParA family protein [Listeria immobilis]
MSVKISFTNYKGGTTKTTSSTNLAGGLAKKYPNAKILLVEADGQGNTSSTFNVDSSTIENTMYDVFLKDTKPEDIITKVYEGHDSADIDILPANSDMDFVDFDFMIQNNKNRSASVFEYIKENPNVLNHSTEDFLKRIDSIHLDLQGKDYFNLLDGKFDVIDKMYDVIIFDTPPEMKAITSSTLAIVDHVIIPYELEKYSTEGIVRLLKRIYSIREEYNPNLNIAGLLPVKFDKRTKLHNQVLNEVLQFSLNNKLFHFNSRIPQSVRFATASATGLPATIVDKRDSKFTEQYYKVIDELVENKIINL